MDALAQTVYTVSELNSEARALLETRFGRLCLLGEISNLVQAQSGHRYFSLKDDKTQVRCALFRDTARNLDVSLKNGQKILAHATVTLYEPRGDFQLKIHHVEAVGDGALQLAFERLKKKLDTEGLFAPEHKKPLPRFPKTIGVITSATGAAIRDILKVLKRRCPSIQIIIYPTLVQGATAAQQIADQINVANQRGECEVLLLSRGGGSLEDLWAFNEEIVARAIFNSKLPVISGIGHEIDVTIADFVADQRAPTPSSAAEQVSPDQQVWKQQLKHAWQRVIWLIGNHLQNKQQALKALRQRLRHPQQQLDAFQQRISTLQHRLDFSLQQQLHQKNLQLRALIQQLNAVNPLNTLNRGYAVASYADSDDILTDAGTVDANRMIQVRLARGKLICTVKQQLQESDDA